MVRQCIVCKKNKNFNPNLIFRRFPVNPERRERWLQLLGLENQYVPKYAQICSNHFDVSDIKITEITGRKQIRPDAEPHLSFPFNEPLSDSSDSPAAESSPSKPSRVPSDVARRTLWFSSLHLPFTACPTTFVCSDHFKEKDYLYRPFGNHVRRELHKCAVPKLYDPTDLVADISSFKFTEKVDHSVPNVINGSVKIESDNDDATESFKFTEKEDHSVPNVINGSVKIESGNDDASETLFIIFEEGLVKSEPALLTENVEESIARHVVERKANNSDSVKVEVLDSSDTLTAGYSSDTLTASEGEDNNCPEIIDKLITSPEEKCPTIPEEIIKMDHDYDIPETLTALELIEHKNYRIPNSLHSRNHFIGNDIRRQCDFNFVGVNFADTSCAGNSSDPLNASDAANEIHSPTVTKAVKPNMPVRKRKNRKAYLGDVKDCDFETLEMSKKCFDIAKSNVLKQKLQIKTLQRSLRRMENRFISTKAENSYLKKKARYFESKNKAPFSPTTNAIYQALLRGRMNQEYNPYLRRFSRTLWSYSPRAYVYVRNVLNRILPHPRTMRKWQFLNTNDLPPKRRKRKEGAPKPPRSLGIHP